MYDYSKLNGKIAECGYTQHGLAKAVKMHPNSLRDRIENRLEFKQDDIIRLSDLLGIKYKDIPTYFFTIKL